LQPVADRIGFLAARGLEDMVLAELVSLSLRLFVP
jgi:hypothetical protein